MLSGNSIVVKGLIYFQGLQNSLQSIPWDCSYPKHFWSFYSMKSKAKRIPETVIYGNTYSTDLTSQVELFYEFFQSIYSKSSLDLNLSSPDAVNPYLPLNVTTFASKVQGILRNLHISKSPGVDNLPARMCKTTLGTFDSPVQFTIEVWCNAYLMEIC